MAAHPQTPWTVEQARTLRVLRLVWALLSAEVLALIAVVYLLVADRGPATAVSPTLLSVAAMSVLFGGAVGYFLRMQAYKRHWVADRIERAGYFTGNLLLFAMVEAGALVAVVCAYRSGRVGPELMTVGIPLLLLALNFPNGRPMAGDADGRLAG